MSVTTATDQVATDRRTYRQTDRPTDLPLLRNGRRGAFRASDVVIAYVEARCRAGLSTDPRSRAILGKYARQVIATGRWEPATLIEAAERFALSRRHPRWFLDWCATILNERDASDHAARKADELAPAALDLSGILKRVSA